MVLFWHIRSVDVILVTYISGSGYAMLKMVRYRTFDALIHSLKAERGQPQTNSQGG